MTRINSPAELTEFRNSILSKRDSNKPCIAVCTGTGCLALGAQKVVAALRTEIKKQGVTITDRFGIPKANPLLAAERDARAQWLATLKQLCLDVEPLHPGPGRPPGR